VGQEHQFVTLDFDISTGAAGTHTIAWEYWNGATWGALGGVSDGTGSFTNTGPGLTVTYTLPTDWDTTTVNSQGPFYYIRARVDTFTDGGNALGDEIDIGPAGGSNGLRTTAFRLIGSNLRPGTVFVEASVPLEVNGVSEGAQCYMEADGVTGPLAVGTLIMNEAADSDGVAGTTFSGTVPQGVIVKARSSGTVGGVVSDEDGVAVLDQTTEARDRSTTNDIDMMPGASALDILYIGAIDEFERVNFDIGTAGVGAYTLTWQYWDGDSWEPLSVTDTSDDFKNVGSSRITFTAPGDWAQSSETSDSGSVGPFYFIRALGDAGGQSTAPLGNTISVAEGNTVKYLPFESTGEIVAGTGLTITAVWIPDLIAS
jgi:hypothetical protein